jgi:hypothetical protein
MGIGSSGKRPFASGVASSGPKVSVDLTQHFPLGNPSQPRLERRLVHPFEGFDVIGHAQQHVLDDIRAVDASGHSPASESGSNH